MKEMVLHQFCIGVSQHIVQYDHLPSLGSCSQNCDANHLWERSPGNDACRLRGSRTGICIYVSVLYQTIVRSTSSRKTSRYSIESLSSRARGGV